MLVLIAVLVGGMLGAWVSSRVGASVPNSRLKQFHGDIEAGKLLMMVDVPNASVEQVREVVLARHPEATPAGQVRPYLVFP